MARKTILLPSLSRVVAGSKATLELPVGPTYRRIIFTASGTALDAAHIERIDVLIDGKQAQTFKNLQRLIDINGYYKRATDTVGQFALHFYRAELMSEEYRRSPGIGTLDVQTFHVEIQLAAGAPNDIAITAHAEIDPKPQKLGVFYKVREFPFSSAVAGEVEIDRLPRGAWYSVLHLFKADISRIVVEGNQTKIIDATKAILERTQKEASPNPRAPVTAKATHIDMLTEGDLAQSIRTEKLQDFRIRMTLDTAGAVDVIAETLDTLRGV
jgi:hypothetical protein